MEVTKAGVTALFVLCAVLGYALGHVQFAIIISSLKGRDIRKEGSGNAGTTNMLRSFGKTLGVLTFIGDLLKGLAACWLCRALLGEWGAMVGSIFAVLGHDFPVFYKFKGGKGAAASLGILLLIDPVVAVCGFVFAVAVALISRYMSLGSLAGMVGVTLWALIAQPWPYKIMFVVLLLLAIYQHRDNITRLLNGTENKLFAKKVKRVL